MFVLGFFSDLRQGNFGLSKTFWIYGVGVVCISYFPVAIMLSFAIGPENAMWSTVMALSLYSSQTTVGLLRATRKYQGMKVWSVLGELIAMFWGILTIMGVTLSTGFLVAGHYSATTAIWSGYGVLGLMLLLLFAASIIKLWFSKKTPR